jgi:CRP-like cAMP-binding protein
VTLGNGNMLIDPMATLPLFGDIGAVESRLLSANSRIRAYPKGAYIFRQGADIQNFYVVCKGTVQIYRGTPDGHEITSDILIAGDCVNAEEIVAADTAHAANARIVEESTILELPIHWMRDHMSDFARLAPRLLLSLADRLRGARKDAEHLSTLSAPQMIACYLQSLCVPYGFDPRSFDLPYSKTLIASRLHMELSTFSRSLKKLKAFGIVVTGNHVAITNLKKAEHFACDHCTITETCRTRALLDQPLIIVPSAAAMSGGHQVGLRVPQVAGV